ncbi:MULTISPECIES: AMP-binding protein [unclassified Nocardioides]|uniref:AMP-binding protein n=1 Tax=unclassified Nocardioides TaxID=2615069 RepID=UPI00005717E2|nr:MULTISPECIES: AMP-binding protein [unclassified Nocardioides]ABL80383.1 AMP-dependent synthetase and ligase [Nocardioides sp. JS614]
MTGLASIKAPQVGSWEAARDAFRWPALADYNIATDCLSAPAGRPALVVVAPDRTTEVSFGRLDDLSSRLAGVLRGLGVGVGDRVAVKLPQSAEMAIAVLATLKLGAVVVTVSNVLGVDAVAHRLEDSGALVLVCAGGIGERELAERTGATLLVTGDEGWLGGALDGHEPLTSFASSGADDPALLLYTSGTTGSSKGVLHGHRVLLGHHAIDLAWDHVREGDVAYSPVDWSWAGGLMLGLLVPLAYGITVVAYREPRFDAERTVAIMRDTGVSVGLFPPTALRVLQRSGALTKETMATLRLRVLISGAEAVESELASWARDELGLSVNNAFGQTEANALIGHANVLGELDPRCLGRPYPGHEVAILDARQQPVGPGVVGEIAVRADDPVCMLRYWNAPEATAAKFRNGWLLTGDSAHADADGNLYFHGRADDIIKSGGYRLGPAEIEGAILAHPDVAECAVVGLPDPQRGQEVTAFVVLGADVVPSPELTTELQSRVRAEVGAHAYPRHIEYVDGLAKSSTGKVDRASLRRAYGPVTDEASR